MEAITGTALKQIVDEVKELSRKQMKSRQKTRVVAIAMFDLPDSTRIKLTKGHTEGIQLALLHNAICERIAKRFGGSVIKHMGDGVFIEFENPIKACLVPFALA
jgi:class 3 adenylate cyclase